MITIVQRIMSVNRKSVQLADVIRMLIGLTGIFANHTRQKVRCRMHIVIDIPEEKYDVMKSHYNTFPAEMREWGLGSIRNGTPLPKGHGRLIDANEYVADIKKHYFDNNTVIRCTEIAIDNAPTIIEADGEHWERE